MSLKKKIGKTVDEIKIKGAYFIPLLTFLMYGSLAFFIIIVGIDKQTWEQLKFAIPYTTWVFIVMNAGNSGSDIIKNLKGIKGVT